jgi:hypothetical protein
MAADENVHRYFTTIGLLAVPQRRLYGVLDLAVGANVPHFISGGVDWSRNSRAEPANRTSSLVRHIVAQASSGEGRAELEHLLSLDHRERTQVLTKTLLGLFTEALGVAEGYLNQETAFSAMGVDSLSVMDVQASINEILHQDLPLARMFTPDGNTGQLAARISKYLDENVQTKEAA